MAIIEKDKVKDFHTTELLDKIKLLRKTITKLGHLFAHSHDETAICEGLSMIQSFFGMDWVCVGSFSDNQTTIVRAHELKSKRMADRQFPLSYIANNSDAGSSSAPEWVCELKKGEEIVISNTEDIPHESSLYQDLNNDISIKSFLAFPTINQRKVNGFICAADTEKNHTWDDIDREFMRLISDLFSFIIEQDKINKKVAMSEIKMLRNDVLLRKLFDKIPIGIELYDDMGNLVRINSAGLKIMGITDEDMAGINLFDSPAIDDKYKEMIKSGQEVIFETQFDFGIVKEQNYFVSAYTNEIKSLLDICVPLKDTRDNVFGYLLLVHDNTEDFKRKEELQYNLAKLKVAIDTGKSFLWEYDVATRETVIDFDSTAGGKWLFDKLKNKKRAQSIDEHRVLIHPDDADRVLNQSITPLINGSMKNYTATYRQYIADHMEWITTNFRAYKHDEEGKATKVICYSTIVTEQMELEHELIRIKEADKIKTYFMENLSHEIRTPLNAIVGFSGVLNELNETEENKQYLDLIYHNTEVLLRIVDDMLDLSKMENGSYKYLYNKREYKRCLSGSL